MALWEKPLNAHEIRRRFLEFFANQGHQPVASSSLVPSNDPTLYFTNAGMVQFKDVFTGADPRSYTRAVTVQKCLRVSGKHNDLENVGRTPRHHTLFEMLGNFSFGDYFKADAISFAWRFLTVELGIPAARLWVTVFEQDEEALQLWLAQGVPAERIQKLGAKDNFWAMGDTGPCGPCSEIHFDHGEQHGPPGGPAVESPRYVEIWNLVFMQYERSKDGSLTPLPRPSIDTGMGLERIAAVMQGVYSNYDTDCFTPIMRAVAADAGVVYGAGGEQDVAVRVIADHARAAAFLIGDGVMPSNEERGYVLRRIMRRAIRYGVKLGLKDAFLFRAAVAVTDHLGDAYPELRERRGFIAEVVRGEEERFSETREKGLALLEAALAELPAGGVLGGAVAFRLYDTYGFPLDLTTLIAEERGLGVDEAGYIEAMKAQKAAGRAAWKGSGEASVDAVWRQVGADGLASTFVGYGHDEADAVVVALVAGGERRAGLAAGEEGQVMFDQTPFYGESGGQAGDVGVIEGEGLAAVVEDATKPTGAFVVHKVKVEQGALQVGQTVRLRIDRDRRARTRLNHTATHLLHAALRAVLGEHVTQKGSLVSADRLRFDFAHHKAMSADELKQVEDMVYAEILKNTAVGVRETSISDARAAGAMALFGEKYGDVVRVVDVPGFSVELCGGTHAGRTGDIGMFRVLSESGVAAGVRRIEALTGHGAHAWSREREELLRAVAGQLKTNVEQLPDAVERLSDERRRLDKEAAQLKVALARAKAGDLAATAREIGGVRVLAAEFFGDAKALREEADRVRDQLGSALVVLAAREEGNVQLIVTVSKDLAGKRFHAGNIVKQLAPLLGGGGGGRPDMAQAGGKNPDGVPEALAQVYVLAGA